MADAPENFPPAEWFAAAAGGGPQHVAFPDVEGGTELVEAEWVEENLFRVLGLPLLVDGVAPDDLIEARWEGGDATPRFLRVRKRSVCRVVRVRASEREAETTLLHLGEFASEYLIDLFCDAPRYGRGVLVFGVYDFAVRELREELRHGLGDALPGEWLFPDTGRREWCFTDTGGQE